ncbi:hypothetical protein SOVF_097390, partial [Spinacia oleracea]
MASGEDHPPSQGDTQDKTKKNASQKRRGPTTTKYIMEDDDGPYALQWSDDGSDIGEFMNSERNRANQAKNLYPHHLGRGGYGKLEERFVQEQLKKAMLSGASSSKGVESGETPVVTPRPRYERWMDGRKDKNGNIPNEKTKLVVEKLISTLMKSVPGELVHGVPLLEDHVKVKILHVVEGEENTPLPLPFFGHESLGEIKGSWAQWPRSQVRLSIENLIDQPPPPKKIRNNLMEGKKLVDTGSAVESRFNDNEEELATFLIGKDMFLALPNSCKQLYNLYKNRDVDFEEDILYYPDKVSFTAYVFGDDLKKLLNMEYIRTSCVDIWI